ncbi:MAG: prephenate/arogenate dehydrogenase [Cyanobacterium sp. T60_A2020_053]|nr:prephenate/arogenate dehydrogenase [Cyanobacterium sp. T60_A2020_053]
MKIAIIGLGLIGSSLAGDLTRLNQHQIIGISRRSTTCEKAKKLGIVHQSSIDLSLVQGCEIVVICTPIESTIPTLAQIIPYLSNTTVVTDVASVKVPIVREGKKLWHNFIGSHPMAGTAEQGIDAVQKNLFNNAPCVITVEDDEDREKGALLRDLWQSVGCNILTTTAEIHDQAVAWISHLPVIISANLIYACMQEKDQFVREFAQKIASSGFRDTSRVGGGNPELGLMMAKNNRDNLLENLRLYQAHLTGIINDLEEENWSKINDLLTFTNQSRSDFIK